MGTGENRVDKNVAVTRTYQIYKDLVELRSVHDIVKEYSKSWGISEKMCYKYVNNAYEIFDIQMEKIFNNLANQQIIRLMNVGARALQDNKLDIVLKSLDLINKTSGIYTDNLKIDANVHADGVIQVNFAGIDLIPKSEEEAEIIDLETSVTEITSENE